MKRKILVLLLLVPMYCLAQKQIASVPSTFGVRAYLRLNSMGASIGDVSFELRCLWIQVAAYLGAASLVYGVQLRTTQYHVRKRLDYLRKKREVRLALKKHAKS